MGLVTMRTGNFRAKSWSHVKASVEVLWIYGGESEVGIWTTKGPVSPLLSLLLLPRKTMKLIKKDTGLKAK